MKPLGMVSLCYVFSAVWFNFQSVDIAGPLSITVTRAKFVDFSQPITSAGPRIVLKRPPKGAKPLAEKITLPFQPMELSAWLMLILGKKPVFGNYDINLS